MGYYYYYHHQQEIDIEIAAELEEVDRALQNPNRSPIWLKLKAQASRIIRWPSPPLRLLATQPLARPTWTMIFFWTSTASTR